VTVEAVSDFTSGTFELVVVVLTRNINGAADGIGIQALCVNGPCNAKLVVFEHTGDCIPRAVDGKVFGVSETIDLEALPLLPSPPAPPGGRLPRPCPGSLLGPINGSLEAGNPTSIDSISGPFPACFVIVALDSLTMGDSDLFVYNPSTGDGVISDKKSDGIIDSYEDVVVVDVCAFGGSFSFGVMLLRAL